MGISLVDAIYIAYIQDTGKTISIVHNCIGLGIYGIGATFFIKGNKKTIKTKKWKLKGD